MWFKMLYDLLKQNKFLYITLRIEREALQQTANYDLHTKGDGVIAEPSVYVHTYVVQGYAIIIE